MLRIWSKCCIVTHFRGPVFLKLNAKGYNYSLPNFSEGNSDIESVSKIANMTNDLCVITLFFGNYYFFTTSVDFVYFLRFIYPLISF